MEILTEALARVFDPVALGLLGAGVVIGLILGALFALTILDALPAVIAFAVTMAVLMIALLIFRFCFCCRIRRC